MPKILESREFCKRLTIQTILDELCKLNGVDPENSIDVQNFLQATRTNVVELRELYKKPGCKVNYSNPNLRNAYMLAYFPYYIEQVYNLLCALPEDYIYSAYSGSEINIADFGIGPAPEILGISSCIGEYFPSIKKMNVCSLDKYNNDWKTCQDICIGSLAPKYWNGEIAVNRIDCNLLEECDCCVISKECKPHFQGSLLFIAQNCFNDLEQEDPKIIRKFADAFGASEPGSLFIIIDLKFKMIRDNIRKLEQEIKRRRTGRVIAPTEDYARIRTASFRYPEIITKNLLTGKHRLIPRIKTQYYCSVIVRI